MQNSFDAQKAAFSMADAWFALGRTLVGTFMDRTAPELDWKAAGRHYLEWAAEFQSAQSSLATSEWLAWRDRSELADYGRNLQSWVAMQADVLNRNWSSANELWTSASQEGATWLGVLATARDMGEASLATLHYVERLQERGKSAQIHAFQLASGIEPAVRSWMQQCFAESASASAKRKQSTS